MSTELDRHSYPHIKKLPGTFSSKQNTDNIMVLDKLSIHDFKMKIGVKVILLSSWSGPSVGQLDVIPVSDIKKPVIFYIDVVVCSNKPHERPIFSFSNLLV